MAWCSRGTLMAQRALFSWKTVHGYCHTGNLREFESRIPRFLSAQEPQRALFHSTLQAAPSPTDNSNCTSPLSQETARHSSSLTSGFQDVTHQSFVSFSQDSNSRRPFAGLVKFPRYYVQGRGMPDVKLQILTCADRIRLTRSVHAGNKEEFCSDPIRAQIFVGIDVNLATPSSRTPGFPGALDGSPRIPLLLDVLKDSHGGPSIAQHNRGFLRRAQVPQFATRQQLTGFPGRVGKSHRPSLSRSHQAAAGFTSLRWVNPIQPRNHSARASGEQQPHLSTTTNPEASTNASPEAQREQGKDLRRQRLNSTYQHQQHAKQQEASRSQLLYLGALILGMLAATYAAVPLYRMFCQATGFGGTTQRKETVEQKLGKKPEQFAGSGTGNAALSKEGAMADAAARRQLVVHFNADVADGLQWKFTPCQREIRLKPGQSTLAFYTAHNRSSEPVTGVSTYNVSPMKAGIYFNKIQCFCFEEQRLQAGEKIDMPVFFYIDPEFAVDPNMDDITNLTLSYTFFKVE